MDWIRYLLRVARDARRDRAGRYALDEPYRTQYLSQPGLALACSIHGGLPYVMLSTAGRPELLQLDRYRGIRAGDRVWIRFEDLPQFVSEILPRVEAPFVLVTGDSDHEVPADFPDAADRLAASGLVTRWFATNYNGSAHGALITGIPIGLNYARKNELIGSPFDGGLLRVVMQPLAVQDRGWDAVRAAAPPLARRTPRAVADFQLHDSARTRRYGGESRADVHRQLQRNAQIVWMRRRRPLPALLAAYAAHAFVVSPHGNALDCYRTWEALLMGCIPIVKRSPIDYLYDGLPVAIVDDWGEITAAQCETWLNCFGDAFDRAHLGRVLSSTYWLGRIGGADLAR
jgi:hypothetical protein